MNLDYLHNRLEFNRATIADMEANRADYAEPMRTNTVRALTQECVSLCAELTRMRMAIGTSAYVQTGC